MTASDETSFSSRKIPVADWALAVHLRGLIECRCRMHLEDSVEQGQTSEDQGESKVWSVLSCALNGWLNSSSFK